MSSSHIIALTSSTKVTLDWFLGSATVSESDEASAVYAFEICFFAVLVVGKPVRRSVERIATRHGWRCYGSGCAQLFRPKMVKSLHRRLPKVSYHHPRAQLSDFTIHTFGSIVRFNVCLISKHLKHQNSIVPGHAQKTVRGLNCPCVPGRGRTERNTGEMDNV